MSTQLWQPRQVSVFCSSESYAGSLRSLLTRGTCGAGQLGCVRIGVHHLQRPLACFARTLLMACSRFAPPHAFIRMCLRLALHCSHFTYAL